MTHEHNLPKKAEEVKSLFQQGYRCFPKWISPADPAFPGEQSPAVDVRKADGTTYVVDCLTGRCSCPGYAHREKCKHRSGLIRLLLDMAIHYSTLREAIEPIRVLPHTKKWLQMGGNPAMCFNQFEIIAYHEMTTLEESEWGCVSLAANLRGSDWALPVRFVCPEEEESDETTK